MTDSLSTKTGKNGRRADGLSGMACAVIGLQFAIGIILFLYLGKWIDARFATGPAGVIAGVFIGAAASFYSVYRRLTAAQKKDDELHGRGTTR